ncbi:hypothetical protein [Pectobacterium versatile]|uniref:hypothetical protein n=1 Tax=Pectobacterium versatile TaxID=2488639 RepID=UPI0038255FEE
MSNWKKKFNKSYAPIHKESVVDLFLFIVKFFLSPLLFFLSGPLSTVIMTLLQLSLGAVLGADISIKISKETVYPEFNLTTIENIWSILNPFTKYFFWFVVLISFLKSIIDIVLNFIQRKEKERIAREIKFFPDKSAINYYYSKIIPSVQNVSEVYRDSTDKDEIKTAILKLMSLMRDFAAHWDSKAETRFSCNLMYYFPVSAVIENQISCGWNDISFFFDAPNPKSAIQQISGVFAVIASVNTSEHFYLRTNERSKETRLLLPVVDKGNTMHSRQTIPGAPEALNTKNYQYLPDILLNISQWLNQEQWSYFSPDQKNAIYNYYLNDKTNRSLISFPCKVPLDINIEKTPNKVERNEIIAVINIYSVDKYMISKSPDLFYQFCNPILSEIAKLCCYYELAE